MISAKRVLALRSKAGIQSAMSGRARSAPLLTTSSSALGYIHHGVPRSAHLIPRLRPLKPWALASFEAHSQWSGSLSGYCHSIHLWVLHVACPFSWPNRKSPQSQCSLHSTIHRKHLVEQTFSFRQKDGQGGLGAGCSVEVHLTRPDKP